MNYPTSLDNGTSLPNPTGSNTQNNPDHAALHTSENAAIIAAETKLGTGSSTPASNTLLIGNGAGTSAWSALTSAQLAAVLSDETGSGAAVFANTPTLITPKVDTINENTGGNGVTVGGVNLKSGTLTTAGAVATTAVLVNGVVTPSKLATGALTTIVTTSEPTAVQTYTDLATAGPSVTVTIGANGLALVGLYSYVLNNGVNGENFVGFIVSGANTQVAADNYALMFQAYANNAEDRISGIFLLAGLTAGSTTFKMQYRVSANTGTFKDRRISVVPL